MLKSSLQCRWLFASLVAGILGWIGAGTPSFAAEVFINTSIEESEPLSLWDWKMLATPPGKTSSKVEVTTTKAHSGGQSLRCFAGETTDGIVGKASLHALNLPFVIGDTVQITGWFWLPPGKDVGTITLMDLECGDNNLAECNPHSPGVRLWVKGNNPSHILWQPGKLGLRTDQNGSAVVPIGEWFELKWWSKLGVGSEGHTKIWINGVLDIDYTGTNIASPDHPDVDFYRSVEVGLSANSSSNPLEIFMDDIKIERQTGSPSPDTMPPAAPKGVIAN